MSNANDDLEIIYRDDDIVAINKPAGMLVHRSRIAKTAQEFAVQKLRNQIGKPVYLVHRLDRPTSGVLLFGLSKETARILAQQFAERSVSKSYRAIVRGHTAQNGSWDEALVEKQDRITDRLANKDKPAQRAITNFETVSNWEIPFSTGKYPNSRYSEVVVKPLTGRKHQIRRHFNHMAHPIIGDSSHGDRRHNRLFREKLQVLRLLLVADRLELTHPTAGKPIRIEAAVGSEFKFAIDQLNRFGI